MVEKKVYEVKYKDLEKFVEDIYKVKNYSFPAVQDCGNDTDHAFEVDGVLDGYQLEEINDVKSGEHYNNYLLLNLLAHENHIPKGYYIISVCW